LESLTGKRLAEKNYYIYIGISSLLLTLVTTVTEIYYINVVNMNAFQLVMVGTVLEIADLIFEIPTGLIADFKGRKFSLIIGVIVTGISFIVEGAFPIFLIILVSQVVWSVGYTLTSGADSAWIADEIGENKVELVFIKGAQIGQILTLVGIFAGTALATIKISLPIIAGGVLFIFLGLYLFFYMPETNFRPIEHEESNSFKKMFYCFKMSINIIAKSKVLLIIIGIAAFEGLYSEGFDRLWTMHFLKNIKFPNIGMSQIMWFSVINSVAMILSIIIMEVIQRKFKKEGKVTMVWVLSIISFIIMTSIMVFAISGNFVLAFLSYCTCRIARNAHEPIYAAWINQNINEPELRATILSTKGQVSAAGQIVGGPVVGAIATIFSVRLGIAISGVLAMSMVILYVCAIRKIKSKIKP
jgi:DHA3 family tetracycline resistance protein-like MFS transporter